jgi:hypothetical protein
MPRTLHPDLRDCLERANPYTELRVEISEPDVGQVLRRDDQFLHLTSATPPGALVSMTPAASLASSARGALILAPSTAALASFTGTSSSYDFDPREATGITRMKGVSWTLDPAFVRATIKNIQVKIARQIVTGITDTDIECQIFQIVKTPGIKTKNVGTPQYQPTAFTEYQFVPLLTPAPKLNTANQAWVSDVATFNFDLSNFALILENIPGRAVAGDQVGTLPKYFIAVRQVGRSPNGSGFYKWKIDTATSRTVANVGTFERSFWSRADENSQWAEQVFADVPNMILNVENYPASGQGVFLVDQGAPPKASSTGRVEFQRSLPPGTAATVELSTAGSGGPWTAVKHGDVVAVRQQTYHLRTTLTSDSSRQGTPEVLAQGIEFRTPVDVSVEGIPTLPTREIALPWPKASIPEGLIKVVRFGKRDYLDPGTVLGSGSATSRLEADIFLASRHPAVTRDKWFRLERMMVTNRLPSGTSEDFTLLSYASRLKRKIPRKVETINSVHTVASSTTTRITVSGSNPLPGTTISGAEYDGRGYYIRIRSTTVPTLAAGYVQVIAGNAGQSGIGTTALDFDTPGQPLPAALAAGDVIEVHSGIFQTQPVSWINYDPADAWYEVLTNLLAIPPERIGIGSLPRGGKPPKVTDIAPGDATTQAKRKITGRLAEEVEGDKILDILSAIMGGVTIEIEGQIVFVQVIPLLDVNGAVTVPLPPVAATFDLRDFATPPQTPLGLEQRATVVTSKYGVPMTTASPDTFPSKATTAVDGDALLWLTQQDLENYATADVPDEISKWLYNTTDEGLYLATALGAQLVRVASTGLRVFALQMVEKHPRLAPGDAIAITIDSYTDYDPATQTQIKGPITVRGVVVRVGSEGRQLSMFIPGLKDNVQLISAGGAGALTGLGSAPSPPILSASFTSAGELRVTSIGDFNTASQKIIVSSVAMPSAATVRAGTPIPQQSLIDVSTGVIFPAGAPAYIAAFAYNANGVESPLLATLIVDREGSGTSAPPVATVTPLNTETDDTTWNLRFDAVAGSGGAGTNLTYTIKQKIGVATETTLFTGNATAFPKDVSIVRHPRSGKVIRFRVTDTATGLFDEITFTVPSYHPEINDTGNPKRGQPLDDGNYATTATTSDGLTIHSGAKESGLKPINRLFAKPLSSSPDTADAVGGGSVLRIPLVGGTDVSGNIDLAGAAWVNKHAGNIRTRSPSQDGTWSVSGVTGSAAIVNDGDAGTNAFHTDTAVAGAYAQVDFGVARSYDSCRLFASTSGGAAVWKVRGSPDGSTWTDLATNFKPDRQGWNAVTFALATYRFFRVELTNSPGAGPYVNEIEFGYSLGNGAGLSNEFARAGAPSLLERVIPMIEEGNVSTFRAGAKESGLKPINRLFAKPLSSDPDTLDAGIDGVTYKRIAGVNGSNQITQASSSSRNRCRLKRSAFLSVSQNTNTAVGFDTEDFDIGALHDTATFNSRITIPVGGGGVPWVFGLQASWANNSDTTRRKLSLWKNGALLIDGPLLAAVNGDSTIQPFFWMDVPNDSDYYEMVVWHNAAAAVSLDITSRFTAVSLW